MKFDLSRFKTIEPIKGSPSISITKNGVTFSKASIQKLGKPAFIEMMIDEEDKVLAIMSRQEDDENFFSFMAPGRSVLSVRIGNRDLKNQLSSLMDWDLENSNGFRIDGEFDKDSIGLFFDLKEAHPIP